MADDFEADDFQPDPGTTAKLTKRNGVQRLELKKTAPVDPEGGLTPAPAEDENPFGFLRPKEEVGSFAHGVSQGATLGFGDELMSAIAALSDAYGRHKANSDAVDEAKRKGTYDPGAASPKELEELREEQAGPSVAQDYRNNRDDFRADLGTAQETNPKSYFAGEMSGSLAVPVPGGAPAKGAAKVLQYAKAGAKLGALGGLGHSSGDFTGSDSDGPGLGTALLDTAGGAVAGGVGGGVIGAASTKLDSALRGLGERRAFKALDPYMKTMAPMLRKKLGREPTNEEVMRQVQSLGGRMLDDDVIPQGKLGRWATSETLAKSAAHQRDSAGELLGGHIQHLDDSGSAAPVSMETLAQQMEARATELGKDPASLGVARNLLKEAQAMRQSGVVRALGGEDPEALTLQAAEKIKRGLQGAVYGVDAARRGGPVQQAKEIAASIARQASEDAIEKAGGPDETALFNALKRKYGQLDTIADTAGYGAARNFRNNAISLGDQQLAQVGAQFGNEPLSKGLSAGALAIANKIARERGSAAAARTLDNLSRSNRSMGVTSTLEPYLKLLAGEDGDNEHR